MAVKDRDTFYDTGNHLYLGSQRLDSAGNENAGDKWANPINFTIGKTFRAVDGSADVAWTLDDIGAADKTHLYNGSYINKASGNFYTCTTAATDEHKWVDASSDYKLGWGGNPESGAEIAVLFENANNTDVTYFYLKDPNTPSFTPYPIKYKGENITKNSIKANDILTLRFYDSAFHVIGGFGESSSTTAALEIPINDTSVADTYTLILHDQTGAPEAGVKVSGLRRSNYLYFDFRTKTLVAPNIVSSFEGNLTGNASTATKLATTRYINGQAFDGTANVSISAIDVGAIPNRVITSGSFEDCDKNGLYTMDNVSTDKPTGSSTSYHGMLVVKSDDDAQYWHQLAFEEGTHNMYLNYNKGNSWGGWKRVLLEGDVTSNEYTLPKATNSILGGIKIGSGLSIDSNGVVSVNSSETSSTPIASIKNIGGFKIREEDEYIIQIDPDNGELLLDPDNALFANGEIYDKYHITIGNRQTAVGWNTRNISVGNNMDVTGYDSIGIGSAVHVTSSNSAGFGSGVTVSGSASFAMGGSSIADGQNSFAGGNGGNAMAYDSFAFGSNTKATEAHSVAMGWIAKATASGGVALGRNAQATVNYSIALGGNNIDTMTDTTRFVVGNSENTSRMNLIRAESTGEVYFQQDINTSGADYAEFIREWADRNKNSEDRIGYFVTVRDNKLYKAEEDDFVIGITSGNPSVVGNADEDYYWKYARDEFNRIIYEDVEIEEEVLETTEDGSVKPVLDDNGNPVMRKTGKVIKNGRLKLSDNYDSNKSNNYIPRKDRPEWDYVGMVGVVPVRDDGTCVPGGFCRCKGEGIGTYTSEHTFNSYYVIERIAENIVSVILK